jgi:hypothetical protein
VRSSVDRGARKEDLTPAEMEQRAQKFYEQMSKKR